MRLLIIAFMLTGLITRCQKNVINLDDEVGCIAQKIESYKTSELPCQSGKSIYQYKFQGAYVYVFNPGDCGADMMSDVYDQECNLICGLGGIAGNLTCNNDNFWEKATEETLIWEN